MKITFVISSLGSGGAERVLSTLANRFINKYDVSIILLSNDDSFYKLDKNISIINANLFKPSRSIFQKIFNNLKRVITLKKIIKKENPDIVISFMTQTNIISIFATKLLNKKIIISERINYDFLQSSFWKILRKMSYNYANALVVQSNYDKDKYSFHNKCKVILNPLQLKQLELIQKQNIILAVGRLDSQKGFDRLLIIYSRLKTTWKLYIAGEGVERLHLESLIKKYNLQERVILLGKIKNIDEYYHKASIFTLTSRMEGFPNVLAEAMGYGCACVAFDCLTGPSDMIEDNLNGFLVENNNIGEFTKKLQLLIDDKEKRDLFAKEAIKIQDKLSVDKIVKEWEDLIKEVICVE